jgi:hypothetical protein
MEFDPNPTVQEILDELNKTPEGKNQLELAALRVVVAKQQNYIVSTINSSAELKEAVSDDDTDE